MDVIVVKIGGLSKENLTPKFFDTLKYWQSLNKKIVIVHGGGAYITDMLNKLMIETKTCNGLRVTDSQALDVTRMVLIGKILPEITATFNQNGCAAVGINASDNECLKGIGIDFSKYGYVGQITDVKESFFNHLFEQNVIPIISPLCLDENQQWLNVNADTTACAIATALHAEKLFLVTDVPGIKSEDEWLESASIADIMKLMNAGIIKNGMIPKVTNAMNALKKGVGMVSITQAIWESGTRIVS